MLTPKLPSFFRKAGYKNFEYTPIYYKPTKDEKEMRKRRMKMEVSKARAGVYNVGNKSRQQSNIRLILIIVALVAIAYYIIYL